MNNVCALGFPRDPDRFDETILLNHFNLTILKITFSRFKNMTKIMSAKVSNREYRQIMTRRAVESSADNKYSRV